MYRQPEQSYYPRARLRLLIRFEDYGDPGTPAVPARIPTLRGGSKDTGAPGRLKVVNNDGVLTLVQPGTNPATGIGGPQDQTTSSDGLTHVVDGVVPISARHERNGIRLADKLTCTVSFADFPFDPRTIRACAVKYFLGCISAEDAARGAEGQMRPNSTVLGQAMPYLTIPDTWVDSLGRTRSNQRFSGWVDTDAMQLDDDSATVQLECTDNTRRFIDQDHPSQLFVAADRPIDEAIANYLASFPQFVGFSVEYRPRVQRSVIPLLSKALSETSKRPGKGPLQGTQTQKVSVWDYLTDVAGMIGHIIRVVDTTVVIQRPRTLYQGDFVREGDPFTGRIIEQSGGDPLVLRARMYGYGANVRSLAIERGYAKRAPTNFEVRSYDTARKKTIYIRYPDRNDRVKSLLPGEGADLKFEVVRVQGVSDPETLRVIAQAHYESRNRNEIVATVETVNLGSFGGDNLDPDVLDLEEGDPVQIEVVRSDTASTVQKLAAATADELVALGFKSDLAAAYVAARDRIALPNTFRTRQMSTDWSNDKTVVVKIAAVNYVVVSVDKTLPDGEEITTDQLEGTQEDRAQVVSVDDQFG